LLVTAVDFVKAFALAFGILVVNVAISFAVVAAYSVWVEPGHEQAYYEAAAQWIAPWSSVAFGWLLFFIACYVFSRRPERNALAFALAVFVAYAAVDLGILFAAGALTTFPPIVALSLASKLVGTIGGVWMAGR
jgi:hypothetical protein